MKLVPAGRPIDRSTVFVLDDAFEPIITVGVTGEIAFGGIGTALGYVGQKSLTSERFRAMPPGSGEGRLFLTGDIGKWLPDGQLELIGRKDFQVKLR